MELLALSDEVTFKLELYGSETRAEASTGDATAS